MDRAVTDTFGARNFGALELGDLRRTRRMAQLVDKMCRHPGGTLPDKLSTPADLHAFYRLMDCDAVTHEQLISGPAAAARVRIAAHDGVVLLLHDATELDYTSKKSLRAQLGQIGQGTNFGYICHNSLAVAADSGACLGLAGQLLHHRADVPARETVKQKRERENRESRLWVRGVAGCGPSPQGARVVDVSDSLSDTFEYMAFELTQGRQFVLRARENRCLAAACAGQQYLFDAVRRLASVGTRTVMVQATAKHQRRTAQLRFAWTAVQLAAPGKAHGEYDAKSLALWAIRVWEPQPPKGAEALEWILLTNVRIHHAGDAAERLGWYERRPIVEEFHKSLKTGCAIESMQFEQIGRLEPAIAILSTVATTLLQLRDAARAPDAEVRPATEVVDPEYVEVLTRHYHRRLGPTPSVRQFYMHVARLGGHQNRRADGLPGWLTLWRGWTKLEAMLVGYRAARRHQKCGQR
jgi:hypothetical protein